ncbi:MAG: TraY domain-containing protein [Gammaproteobacteria bacterium]|nr:TraY domain-containing protein [Gammaproteobacteria bacterium]
MLESFGKAAILCVFLNNKKVFAMRLSVRLNPEEERLLEKACQRSARSKSDIVRQGVREVCARIVRGDKTPYELGADLFGAGDLAGPPTDKTKRTVWKKLIKPANRID